jgi:hypothetical protein
VKRAYTQLPILNTVYSAQDDVATQSCMQCEGILRDGYVTNATCDACLSIKIKKPACSAKTEQAGDGMALEEFSGGKVLPVMHA